MPRRCCWRSTPPCTWPGRRDAGSIPLSSFFTGISQDGDGSQARCITAVEIPKPLPQFVRFYKVAKRRLDDISTVAAAMALDVDPHGRVRRARFAFGGVAATPIRVAEAEAAVVDQPWNDAAVERVQRILDRIAEADERSSRVEGVPTRSVEVPRREVPVGARAVKIVRHTRSARERPRSRDGRGALCRRSVRAIPEPPSRVAGAARRTRTRS